MRLNNNRSLSSRLFAVFFLVLVPLLVAQFSMYAWGRDAVTDELNTAAQSNVVYLRDNLEQSIYDMYTQLEHLLSQEAINEFFVYNAVITTSDYYMRIRDIMSLLQFARNSNPYIHEIRLYYAQQRVGIMSSKKMRTDIDAAEMLARIEAVSAQNYPITELDGEYVLWSSKPVMTNPSASDMPPYYMEIILSEEALRTHLSSFSNYSNKNALMYNHTTGSMLMSDNFSLEGDVLNALGARIANTKLDSVYAEAIRPESGEYLFVCGYSPMLNCSFVQIIPADTLMSIPRRFQYFIIAFSVLSVFGALAFTIFLRFRVRAPLAALAAGFTQLGEGDFDARVMDNRMTTLEFKKLAAGFNDMLTHLKQLVYTNYTTTIQLQRAELKQLQSQINPHFLYNSFFVLRHMVKRDDREQALKLLAHLGDYFKYTARSPSQCAPLSLEYSHAMDYLNIQLMRFEGRVKLSAMKLNREIENVSVPRLILQPVFENIFDHCDIEAGKRLTILTRFERRENGYFSVFIEDSGAGLTDEVIGELNRRLSDTGAEADSTGLINIHRRLMLAFGRECGLRASRSELGGLCVELSMHEGIYENDSPHTDS